MSSLRLALKQSLQDATPSTANATETTTATSSSGTTNTHSGGSSTITTFRTSTTTDHHHHQSGSTTNPNHTKRSKESTKIRPRNDDHDNQSTSSEENEASLNDLDEMDDDDSSMDELEERTNDRSSHSHMNHSKTKKTKTDHHQQQRNNNDAAANRIQKQYRKTKKKHASKVTITNNTAMSSSNHHHHHHPSQSRTKAIAVLNKKKPKKEKHLTKPSTTHHRTTATAVRGGTTSTRDPTDEEEEYRRDASTDNLQHHDDDDDSDSDDNDSTVSSSSWTVSAPSEPVIRHMASLSNETCIQNMVPGLRVKVLFDKPIRKWYGGYIEQIYDTTTTSTTTAKETFPSPDTLQQHPPATTLQKLRRIKIAYDDGTSEMTHFPDRKSNPMIHSVSTAAKVQSPTLFEDAIVIDAVQNGQHMTVTALEIAQRIYTPPSMSSSLVPPLPVILAPNNDAFQLQETPPPTNNNLNESDNDNNDRVNENTTKMEMLDQDRNNTQPSQPQEDDHPPDPVRVITTMDASSTYHQNESSVIPEIEPILQSVPELSLQQQQHVDVQQPIRASDLEDTKRVILDTNADDVHHDVSEIKSVDTNTATMTTAATSNYPITTSKGSQELILVPNSTVDDSRNMDEFDANDNHILDDSVTETPLVTTTTTVHEQEDEDVVMEDNNSTSSAILRDPPNDDGITVEALPMNADVAVTEKTERELEQTTDKNVPISKDVENENVASKQESSIVVDDTRNESNTSFVEPSTSMEQEQPMEKSTTSDVHRDTLQPEEESKLVPSQLPTFVAVTELSSTENNISNSHVNSDNVAIGKKISVDEATTDVASTINDVAEDKYIAKIIVDDEQLGSKDDKKNENDIDPLLSATPAATVQIVVNESTAPETIVVPPNHDETITNKNVDVTKVPAIDMDALQITLPAATATPSSIVKNDITVSTHSTEDEIDDNNYNKLSNDATIDMDTASGNMDISKASDTDATNASKSIDSAKDTTADFTTVPPTISKHDPVQEDKQESDIIAISSNRVNDDIDIDGMTMTTADDSMAIEPMYSVVEEKRSSLDDKEEAISQVPIESNINSTITEDFNSTLNQIVGNDKHSLEVVPPLAISTKTTEGEKAGTRDDSHSESMSTTNKSKRASPHTLSLQNDEPPKKKLTIRIPVHKMKQKSSNAAVTTPKSIHISISGPKEVPETANVDSALPSQPALDALSSNVDVTDESTLSPRQLKKLALKLERKRQKMIAQKNIRESEKSQTIAKDTTESMPTNDTGPILTPTTDTNVTDDDQIRLKRQEVPEANESLVMKADGVMDSVLPSTTTSEEITTKKKKKGVRRKAMEGDSDPKTSKESESELDDSQWVQCDECGKWRIIPTRVVQELPKQWYCRDNIYDPKHSSCDAPEQTDKEVAKEKKRRLKKKQRLLKTAEEAAAAAASLSHEPGTNTNATATATENIVERSPHPPRDAAVDVEKPPKQQKRVSSMDDSQLPELPLTTTESRPPKKEKKLASTVKRGRSVESMDKLVPPSEDIVGAAAVAVTDVVKPRGRGRPRRANNAIGSSTNTSASKESIPIGGTSTSIPTPTAADDAENLEWVQCEKCDKWRKLPPHVSADDLPDVWTCTMNTWNPSSASCDAPEDKSDGLQDINVFGTNGSAAGKLTYRHLIFGSNGRKANRPISEKTCAAESIFSAHFDEDVAPTKVLYADSSAYIARGRPNISVDDNEGMSVLELMSHSKLWQELRGMSSSPAQQPGHPPKTSLYNNDTLRMNAFTYDTLPTDVQGPMKEYVLRALDTDTLSGDEVVQRIQQQQSTNATEIDEKIFPYCTATVIVTTLCDLVKIGTVECIQKIGVTSDGWYPHYRRTVQRVTPINDHHLQQQQQQQQQQQELHTIMSSLSNTSQELQQQRRRLSFPMKLSKPWKHGKMNE